MDDNNYDETVYFAQSGLSLVALYGIITEISFACSYNEVPIARKGILFLAHLNRRQNI